MESGQSEQSNQTTNNNGVMDITKPSPALDNSTTSSDSKPALSAPITHGPIKTKKAGLMTFILSALLVLVILIAVLGVYSWQHKQVASLNSQVSSLNAQNASLSQQLATAKAAAAKSSTQASVNSNYAFKISQLGVTLTVPAGLADITYQIDSQGNSVNLSTQTLTSLDSSCGASATGTKALGILLKGNGEFKATTGTTLVKQFSGSYIAYSAPTANCSSVNQVNNLASSLITDLKNSFSTIVQVQ